MSNAQQQLREDVAPGGREEIMSGTIIGEFSYRSANCGPCAVRRKFKQSGKDEPFRCCECGAPEGAAGAPAPPPATEDELRKQLATVTAERDRWAARVKLLERRLSAMGDIAEGRREP